jgi:hypothetical protein
MTTRPYELLARIAADGSVSAHTRRMILDEEGKDLQEANPVPLAGTTDPDFTAFATQFSAAEKATLEATIQELRSDKADLDTALDTEQALTATL